MISRINRASAMIARIIQEKRKCVYCWISKMNTASANDRQDHPREEKQFVFTVGSAR